jgi:putative membrane protein
VTPDDRTAERPPPRFDDAGDATRRTWLANERTWLAWVRTGLTSTAVALGVGKIVPDLAKAGDRWPYTVLGVGYALLGALLVLYGFQRRSEVDAAIRSGRYVSPHPRAVAAFAALATLLGVGSTVLLIAS